MVRDPETDNELFARVKVPQVLPRFIALPEDLQQTTNGSKKTIWTGVPLEQVIAHNLETLFHGMVVEDCYAFRVTRNADIAVEEDEADDLLLAIEQEVRKRRLGKSAVRLEIHSSTPDTVKERLIQELGLASNDVYSVEGLLGTQGSVRLDRFTLS